MTQDTLSPQEAIIYLMVMTSASDGDMQEDEMRTIGRVVRSFPLFSEQDEHALVSTAAACGRLMSSQDGLHKVFDAAKTALPAHLSETAYAAMVDVVTADGGLDVTELHILQMARDKLGVSDQGAGAIEHAARARHTTLDVVDDV
jgi:uncharacterized tellurite resistance protein B-like protein